VRRDREARRSRHNARGGWCVADLRLDGSRPSRRPVGLCISRAHSRSGAREAKAKTREQHGATAGALPKQPHLSHGLATHVPHMTARCRSNQQSSTARSRGWHPLSGLGRSRTGSQDAPVASARTLDAATVGGHSSVRSVTRRMPLAQRAAYRQVESPRRHSRPLSLPSCVRSACTSLGARLMRFTVRPIAERGRARRTAHQGRAKRTERQERARAQRAQ